MRSRPLMVRLGASLLLLSFFALPSQAAFPESGRIYLSFSPDGRVQDLHVDALTPFDFYLLVDLDPAAGDPFALWVVEGKLEFSSEIFLSDIAWIHHNLNIGDGVAPGSYDFQLAFGDCVGPAEGPRVICSFRGILTEEADDLFVGVGPATRSSVDDLGPGWIGCPDTKELRVFRTDDGPQMLSINRPVPVNHTTWTGIKAIYR